MELLHCVVSGRAGYRADTVQWVGILAALAASWLEWIMRRRIVGLKDSFGLQHKENEYQWRFLVGSVYSQPHTVRFTENVHVILCTHTHTHTHTCCVLHTP